MYLRYLRYCLLVDTNSGNYGSELKQIDLLKLLSLNAEILDLTCVYNAKLKVLRILITISAQNYAK